MSLLVQSLSLSFSLCSHWSGNFECGHCLTLCSSFLPCSALPITLPFYLFLLFFRSLFASLSRFQTLSLSLLSLSSFLSLYLLSPPALLYPALSLSFSLSLVLSLSALTGLVIPSVIIARPCATARSTASTPYPVHVVRL